MKLPLDKVFCIIIDVGNMLMRSFRVAILPQFQGFHARTAYLSSESRLAPWRCFSEAEVLLHDLVTRLALDRAAVLELALAVHLYRTRLCPVPAAAAQKLAIFPSVGKVVVRVPSNNLRNLPICREGSC